MVWLILPGIVAVALALHFHWRVRFGYPPETTPRVLCFHKLSNRLLVDSGLGPPVVPVEVRMPPPLRTETPGEKPPEVLLPGHLPFLTASSPRSRSAMRSGRSSMPIDTRRVPGQMPAWLSS